MTNNVETIPPDATLHEAAEKMKDLDVGVLPIRDGEEIVGILTDRDIVIRSIADGLNPATTKVAHAMSAPVFACTEDQDISQAIALMESRQLRRVLVLDQQNKLVGILTLGDLSLQMKDHEVVGETLERVCEPSSNARQPAPAA